MPQVSPRAKRLLLAAALAATLSCAPENRLEGSLAEVLNLSFDKVELRLDGKALTILYERGDASARDVVLKILVRLDDVTVEPEQEVDLVPEGAPLRVVATRAVANDPVRFLPPVKRGSITFDAPPEAGKPLSGSFRLTFGDGGDAGRGRQALGTFTAGEVVQGVGS